MNALDGVIDNLDTQTFDSLEKEAKPCEELWQNINRFFKNIDLAIETYESTGVAPKCNFKSWETFEVLKEQNSTKSKHQRSSLKENIQPNENELNEDNSIKTRPRRNAFKEATENINKQSSISLQTKLRRPDVYDNFENVYIKKEKISISSPESDFSEVKIKTEIEGMSAPTRPAPRKKRQKKTESKVHVKVEKIEEADEPKVQDFDVENTEASLLVVASDNDKTVTAKEQKKLAKRSRSLLSDEGSAQTAEKRAKSPTESLQRINDLIIENNNATYIAKSCNKDPETPATIMNATIVIDKSKYVNNNNNLIIPVTADMMTDDESEEETKAKTPPLIKKITKTVKQVFSPFEQSPVKKKIEAFEKLKQECNAIPVRVTRTKTRAQAKEVEEDVEVKSNVKEKAKFFTPEASTKFIPPATSTSLKASSKPNQSLLGVKSAQKVSQYTYKEREKKEQEALKKREALMQAQKTEKRRKREEKQLKAQQQREALEKEKLKALEMQRLKDERHRKLLEEQERKKQQQREELEKKRMMAKMRAIEEKRKEEARRLEEQRKVDEISAKLAKQDEEMAKLVQKQKLQTQQKQQVPIYMTTKAPVLPTDDCYDSDDEEYKHAHVKEPSWARGSSLKEIQFCIITAGEAIKNTYFSRQAQTPDLQEIFEVIQPEKLKRSSSATWHKPPRYTMLPI